MGNKGIPVDILKMLPPCVISILKDLFNVLQAFLLLLTATYANNYYLYGKATCDF